MASFNNLKGLILTEALYNSDNKPIKGTENEIVVLYNTDHLQEEKLLEMNTSDLYKLENKGLVVILDKKIVDNLVDKKE